MQRIDGARCNTDMTSEESSRFTYEYVLFLNPMILLIKRENEPSIFPRYLEVVCTEYNLQ